MSFVRTSCFFSFLFIFLHGCGFQPMYGQFQTKDSPFLCLKIAIIPDRNGQILRNYLLDMLTPYGQPAHPKYMLSVIVKETFKGIGIRKDATTSRKEVIISSTFSIIEISSGKVIHSHRNNSINSFALKANNYYADVVSEDYAVREALRLSAVNIKTNLAAYFSKSQLKCK